MKPDVIRFREYSRVTIALLALLSGAACVTGQTPTPTEPRSPAATTTPAEDSPLQEPSSSTEQGQTPLDEAFDLDRRRWRIEKRRKAIEDTKFKFNLRSMYLGRDKYDNTESEAMAIGGWAGLKTGYFLDHIAFGITGYTSQRIFGDKDEDGTLLLEPGQGGYSALGELYADIRIIEDMNLYVGRKEYDTPFINRNDTRMTPNTFEAIVLQGRVKLGSGGGGGGGGSGSGKDGKTPVTVSDDRATLKYGLGYFDKIKERNSDEFVSMSEDAGADVDRGVFTAGAIYQKGQFSIGAIDYYSPDIINIGYAEAKVELPINDDWKPRLAAQFVDQRSVGDDLLQDESFSGQELGIKAELPVGPALFTAGYTHTTDGTNMQSPWSGYPGYTSVQVEDFNRAGEDAFLLRGAYEFSFIEGLSAYALWVHGTDPDQEGQFARDEVDFNLQWAPKKGVLKGLSLRVRYAMVEQHGGDSDRLTDLRMIANYAVDF
jgi:hypothetical protein